MKECEPLDSAAVSQFGAGSEARRVRILDRGVRRNRTERYRCVHLEARLNRWLRLQRARTQTTRTEPRPRSHRSGGVATRPRTCRSARSFVRRLVRTVQRNAASTMANRPRCPRHRARTPIPDHADRCGDARVLRACVRASPRKSAPRPRS
jgi:hypothetical protein